MRWFINLQTGKKLITSFSLLFLLLIFVMLIAFQSMRSLVKNNETLYNQEFFLLENLMNINTIQNASRVALLSMIISNSRNEQEQLNNDVQELGVQIETIFQNIANLKKNDAAFVTKLENLKAAFQKYKQLRGADTIPAILAGKIDLSKGLSVLTHQDSFEKFRDLTQDLIKDVRQDAQQSLVIANKAVDNTNIVFLGIGILSLVISIALIMILNMLISNPLKEISRVAEKISRGELIDLDLKGTTRSDEVGVLTDTFSKVSTWLQGVADTATRIATGDLTAEVSLQSSKDVLGAAFQTMVKNLRQLTVEISEAINFLTTAVTEISAATAELASSTTETATSVSETTSTIEEVRQTSQVASQKAKSVADSAQKTADVSQSGKKAADEIIEMIGQIHNQMESIAESMVRLSEQGQAIGSIIESVEDLAQQSNLLAVNASIEAAKAGEQGKGFSVVAQEVKSLANQSKKSTNQVRNILNDIQKATGTAVMATEQGTKAVQDGVVKTKEAGESIFNLVKNVTEASHAATQIAAVTHQQLVGMDQATVAMENIKQASSQNVESTKQLEIATKNITDLGGRLKQLIGQYKLNS